ncbi:putative metalloprotease YpwA [compost metagenome]
MKQETADKWKLFVDFLRKIKSYEEAVALMHWDLRTGAPRKGAAARSETIGLLSTEAFKLQTSEQMGEFLKYFNTPEVLSELDETGRRMVLNSQ